MAEESEVMEQNPDSVVGASPHENKSDCYAAGERTWMEAGQRLRAYWLSPLLRWLTQRGITADFLTVVSGVIGFAFVPCYLSGYLWAATATLVVHVLMDGLDGPLARFQMADSSRGSFTDTFTDQAIVTAVTIAWMILNPSSFVIATGSAYLFLYALVVGMAMVRNALHVPYSWLVRPRFVVYVSIVFDAWNASSWTIPVMTVCNVLLAIKTLSGFFKLRRQLPGPAQEGRSN